MLISYTKDWRNSYSDPVAGDDDDLARLDDECHQHLKVMVSLRSEDEYVA